MATLKSMCLIISSAAATTNQLGSPEPAKESVSYFLIFRVTLELYHEFNSTATSCKLVCVVFLATLRKAQY